MPIQAVIFDIGGVLVRTENHDKRHEWEARLGVPRGHVTHALFDSEEAARAMVGSIPESEMWASVARKLGLPDDQVQEFQLDFFAGERFDIELAQFIHSLRSHIKVGIISNAWSDAREVLNRKFNLGGYVDDAIYSAEVKLAKPDVRIFQLALERLGVRAEEAVFVDDVLENVQAAQSLGMKGVQFKSTEQTIQDVKRYLNEHPTT
jgi:epoxide hydrolase-like predicted phosphatase